MKYSKSAIGLLTAQYRSVLKKCWMINVGLFALGAALATPAMSEEFDIKYLTGTLKDGDNINVTAASPSNPVIAKLTLTATDIKSILGNSGSLNADTATTATEADTANAVRLNTAVNTDAGTSTGRTIGDYINKITALETAGYVTGTYVDENYAKKTDIANVAKTDGSSIFSSIKIGSSASNGELSYSNESGKIYTDKAFQATGNLIVKSATDNTVTAALGVDKSGANSRLTADHFKATNLYIGNSDAITGVANTISDTDTENVGKLASASAVKASVDGVKNYADGLSAAVYDGSNAFAKFKMGEVEVDGITAASTGDTKKLITETAVDGKITAATTDLSADVATLKGGKTTPNSVLYNIDNEAENAKYTGAAAANSIGAAIKGNADKLAGLVVNTGAQETVQNAINKAKTEAQAYSGTAVSEAATVSAAIDKNATSIADLKDASKEGSIAKLIEANAKDATYSGDITISEAISAASGSIGTETLTNANGNLNGGTTGTFTGSVKAAINGLDATLGKIYGLATGGKGNLASTGDTVSGHLSALDNAIGNRTTAYGTSNYAATGNADLNVATAIKNLDTAVYNNLNGISTATLNIGGSAKDVHIGQDGQGLNIASTGATLLTKDGSSITNGLTIGSTTDATSSLGYTNSGTFSGIKVSKTSANADTVTITDGTNNVVFKGGKMTANGAELSTLKMGANEAKGIDTGTNYAATDATAPAADNIQLASTATVYNSVHALAGQMGNFETIANVHGVNGTESLKFGENANNIRIGSENLISGNKVLATGIDVNGLVSGTRGINLRVANGDSSDNNTSVNVTESQVKLGSTVSGKFYGITSNYDSTVPADSSIKFSSDDKYVEVKGGNLNATGDIKTATGTVEGAHLKATTDLKIGDSTPVVGVDAGTDDLDNTADNTILASAKTVYRAMSSAQGYTPADALKAGTHIFNGVTTNKAALDIVGTKLDGLTMADGTTAAATVQAALQDVKSAADTAVNNLKDGDVAANKAKLAGLNAGETANPTVQDAINYAKAQAGVYTSATGMQDEGKIFNGLTTFTDAMDAAGAGIMANTARFAGFASGTQTVAEYVDANAKDATYSGSGGTKVTIAQEIAKKANTADLKTAAYRNVAADFTPVPTDYHDTDIATWVADNDTNIADVTTTFKVLSKKLSTVQHDLMDNGDNASSIARALGGTAATDTLPGMVQKLALNAPYSSTATYDEGSIGEAVQKNTAKFGDLGTNTVAQAIAAAGASADGKYVAKTDLTPANGQVVLGHASTDNYNDKGTDFTVNTADSTIKATVFKPSSASDMTKKTSTMEMDKDGVTFTTAEVETSGTTTKTASIKDGVVSAEGLKLGTNDVTSIDSGEALDITTDVAAADKKVMATDAAVKATVKALAEGAVATNTANIAKNTARFGAGANLPAFVDNQTVADYLEANADSAKHGDTTIGGAITANTTKLAGLTNDTVQESINAAKSGLDTRINKVLSGNTLINKVTGTNGEAMIFNESDGGGAMFTHKTGDVVDGKSYVGVHDGSSNLDIGAQIYVLDGSDSGVRLNANMNGIYYVKGAAGQGNPAKAEIVTLGTAQNADYTQPTDARTSIGNANTIQGAIDAVAAATDTNTTNIDTNTQAIATLNGGKTVENSVDYKVYNNAKDALYKAGTGGAEDITIAQAIDAASQGASDALAKVLNGETAFSKLSLGTGADDDWSMDKNVAGNLVIRNGGKPVVGMDKTGLFTLSAIADGQSKQYLAAGNGYFKLSKDGGDPYLHASNSTFALYDSEGKPRFLVDNATGNVSARGSLTLNDGTASAPQELTAAKIEQITTNKDAIDLLNDADTEAGSVKNSIKTLAEKATYTPATGEESAAVITAQANTINGAILALDKNAVATNNAIGNINNLHGDDNAMMDYSGNTPVEAANIVEAVNNISATLGTIHGLKASVENGDFDAEGSTWYKDGAGNLFAGSEVDDHLAELAASIGNRNYAADTPYLTANESVATSLTVLANNLKGVADGYVTKEYFNGGTATTPATISMGANASDIVIGHVAASDTDTGTTFDVNHAAGTITSSVVTAGAVGGAAPTTTTTELSKDGFKVTNGGKTVTVAGGDVATDSVTITNGAQIHGSEGTTIIEGTTLVNGSVSAVKSLFAGENLGVTGDTTLGGKLAFGGNQFTTTALAISSASTDAELPTAKAVYDVVKAETTVEAAANGNYAAGSVKDALNTVDSRMGNVSWYKNSTHYANPNSTAGLSLSAAIRNIDANVYAKVGAVDFADTMNYVSSADTDLTTAIKSMDTNVKAAIDNLDGTYVTKDYFNGKGGAAVKMGISSNDIEIGKQNFDGEGNPTGLISGIKIASDATAGNTISIGSNNGQTFNGIELSDSGKTATFKGTNNDVEIKDGEVTAEKATVKTLAFTDGAATNPTITTATSVDNTGKDVLAAGVTADGEELASTLTVKNTVAGAVNVEAAANGNYAAGTVKTAVADIDAAIGNRDYAEGTPYLHDNESVATSLTTLAGAIDGVAKDYVKTSYFNNGDDNGLISMGSGATTIQMGKVDAASGLNGIIINNSADDKTIKIGNNTQNVTVDGGDLTATGAVKAASFKIGEREVTSIDAGAALSYSADAADADKKVMATDATVINTVKALAEGEVATNTANIAKNTARFGAGANLPAFADNQTVADYLEANGAKAQYKGGNTIADVFDAITKDNGKRIYNVVTGTNGKALIFNEKDGGGAKFEHTDGTWSAVAVNDGGATGIAAQIYAINNGTKKGTRLNVTTNGMFYTNGATSAAYEAIDELVTLRTAENAVYTPGTDAVATKDAETVNGAIMALDGAVDANAKEIAKRKITISKATVGNTDEVELATIEDGTAEDTAVVLTLAGATKIFDAKQGWMDSVFGIDSDSITPYATAFNGAKNINLEGVTMTSSIMDLDGAIADRKLYNGTHYANPNSAADADPISLSQAIKNMDDNVFAKVGTVDLSTATNYANTTTDPATNLTQAVVNIDKNVKAEINSLDNKFVTKDYFNNGEPAQIDDGTGTMIDNPNAGLISMGSGATQINIGKTVPAGTPTSAVLDSGLSINNTNGDVMLGQISQVGSGATAKSVVETGLNVDNTNYTASLISANGQSSINAVDVNRTTIKIGMTTTDNSGNPLFSGVSINNGVMTNADPADANKKATFASDEVKVASSATDYTSTTAAGTTVTKKDGDKTYTANMAADEVSVADGTNTASVKADEMSVADGNGNSASVKADKMSVTDGTNTSSMTATTVSLADTSGKSNTITKTGMTIADGTTASANVTSVEATGVTVTNGTSTTTVAADGVTSSKFAFNANDYATGIDAGSDLTDPNTTATIDGHTIATTATVKASVDGMVADIEKQIHGDGPASTVNIGDKAGTTFIGETYKDMAGKEQVAGGMAVRMTYEDPAADPAVVTNREVEITALLNDGSGVSVDLNADNQTIDLVAAGDDDDSATGVRINHKNQTITLVSADEDTEQTTGVEINNKNGTIAISSANDDDHTATGLSIVNDKANNKHTIDLAYNNTTSGTSQGLSIDADEQSYSLGSTDVTNSKFSGLDIDAAENTYALGKGTIDDQGEFTLDYGMTMDAENGVTTFANKEGKGVTMNKGDMTVTDSATVGSVDAQGKLSGVKLDKSGTAQASESVTAGQVDGDGKLSGNGVQMKNDGSATFAAEEGNVNIAKGSVQADNSALIGNKDTDDENYIEFAMNSETDPDTGAETKSAVATFASSDGNVEIAKGEVTADKKVTVGDDTNSVVLDKDGNIAATSSALIGSETDDGQGNKTLTGVKLDKDGNAQASNSILAGTETDDGQGNKTLTGVKLDRDGNATASKSVNVGDTTGTDYASIAKDDEGKVTATFASEAGNVVIADGEVTADKKVTVGEDKVVLDDEGNITADKDLTVKGLGTFGKDKKVVINEGDINADGTVTGDKLVANTEFELAGTKVHSIDTGTAKVEESGDVLATTASIFRNAEDGDYNAAEGTYTTVDATTINEALTAVDNIIGNFPDGLNYDNHNLDNGGQAKPENIVDAFNNIDATLGQIHGLAAKVGVENGSMNLGQNTTVEEHLTALAGSIGNRTSYTEQNVIKNNESVAKSLDALDMAVGDVSKLQGTAFANAGNLSDAVVQIDDKLQNLDGRVESVEHDLKDVHHELRRGMASMAAMSALVPNSRSTGKTSLSLGTGAYSGHAAVALGGFHYLTDNLMLNAGAAWSNSRDAVYRVGVTYSF